MTSDNDLFLVNNVEFNELEFRSLESKVQLVDYRNDKSNSHFYYKYVTIDGSKSKSKGEVFMNENYLVVTSEAVYGYQSPDVKSVILKNHINENEWSYKLTSKGYVFIISYNSTPSKYKSSGGTLTMETSVGQMIYYLIKKQPFN